MPLDLAVDRLLQGHFLIGVDYYGSLPQHRKIRFGLSELSPKDRDLRLKLLLVDLQLVGPALESVSFLPGLDQLLLQLLLGHDILHELFSILVFNLICFP